MSPRRFLTATLATTAALAGGLLSVAPASALEAADTLAVEYFTAFGPDDGPVGRSFTASPLLTRGTANGDGTRNLVYSCTGTATGDVVSVAITKCALLVNGATVQNVTAAAPGPAVATGNFRLATNSGATVQVCTAGAATYADSSRLASGGCTKLVKLG